MKTSLFRLWRILRWLLVIVSVSTLAYVFSIGPASGWVARTITATPVSASTAATYDQRLDFFYRFYSPVLYMRERLLFQGPGWVETMFEQYEAHFHPRPCVVDGRRVFTAMLPVIAVDGKSGIQYARQLGESLGCPLGWRTQAYYLPRTQRILIVVDPANNQDWVQALFSGGCNLSVTGYADLTWQ